MPVLLTGYYSKKFAQVNPFNDYTLYPTYIEQYPNNVSVMTVNSVRIPAVITVPGKALFYEQYTWTTYEDEKVEVKLGSITYNAFYPDSGTDIFTTPSIQEMTVLGADGIYKGTDKVVMDFTQPPIRTIKFLFKE